MDASNGETTTLARAPYPLPPLPVIALCERELPDGSVVILPLDPNIPQDNEPAAQSCAAEIRRAFDRGHAEGI